MLNMALLFGNDYYRYWTKLILALNVTYISRVLYYTIEKKYKDESYKGAGGFDETEMFGLLNMIFYTNYLVYLDTREFFMDKHNSNFFVFVHSFHLELK